MKLSDLEVLFVSKPYLLEDKDGSPQPYLDLLANYNGTGQPLLWWAASETNDDVKLPASTYKIDSSFVDLLNTVSDRRSAWNSALKIDCSACDFDTESANQMYITLSSGGRNNGSIKFGGFVPTGDALVARATLIGMNFTIQDGLS